jgi:hypothetical protein
MMKRILLLLIVVFSFWEWGCQNQTDRGQPGEARQIGSANKPEEGGPGEPARVPTEAEADTLLALQQQIMLQPENSDLRRELGRRAIDASAGIVWAMGRGKVNPQASSPGVAQSQAEQAALLDASRWAAYLIEWQKTDYATNFGKVQASVPGAKVERKMINDSLCVVLVQVPWKQP